VSANKNNRQDEKDETMDDGCHSPCLGRTLPAGTDGGKHSQCTAKDLH